MNLTNPADLKPLLVRHGWRPQKRFGQHFLCSPKVVQAIVDRAEGALGILEIGPGPGALTQPLSEQAYKLIAWELDPIAVSALSETAPKAIVKHGDVLLADLALDLKDLPEPRMVVSNMPYNITGPLLTQIAGVRRLFSKAILMMQMEVGKRILAQGGDSDLGSLSIFLQTQFQIEKVILAPAGAFYPPPKVQSIVLQFTPIETELGEAEEDFFAFVRLGFQQPRKTLQNNLSPRVSKEELVTALEQSGFSPSARPHELGVQAWRDLYWSLHGPDRRSSEASRA